MIYQITKSQFEAFKPARGPATKFVLTEKSWFRDNAGNIIGVTFVDKADEDWNWAILGRDEKGEFRWIEGGVSLITQEAAERALKEKMLELEQTGTSTFQQD